MDEPSAQFQDEDLIDILWRQDVDLGVERDIFDGCLRHREEETTRARETELKRERELERIMQRLQKLDKETGEFLPSPSSVNSQAVPLSEALHSTVFTHRSPVTQNPLLSALLFSQKSQKPPSQEQAFSELLSLPDLQYYLDVLESEASSLPLEDITEICHQNLPEPQRENSADALLCDITQTISDSFEVVQPLSSLPSDPVEILETCIQTFSDPGNSTPSPSNTIYSCSTPENQVILPKHQINSSDSTLSEFCPYTINTSSLSKPEQLNSAPQTLIQYKERHVQLGFDDSASVGSVDLETSLYAADTFSNGQSDKDELESIQSEYTDLLPLSLHSETEEATLCETITYAHHQTQNESTPEYSQREPQANLSTTVRRVHRDEQQAQAMNLPLSVHDIINLPVEAFNEAISSCKLNHTQQSLIRDIRRRGKNKMAAQSCRKRKMDGLNDLEEEIEDLKREKEQIKEENERNTRELHETKVKLRKLYNEVFRQLRDEHGNSYNPKEYKLQHSTDGTVYLLPHSTADKTNTPTEDLAVAV
ncbi:nuclear factor erythroid 2-related factor 2b [Carassius gibelio]|uniref:nuclear factor erythroid 2-related factor 2b n=1 Tax=Carassius gibelio TaxID=101364 RepID=UPI0022789825|nr:nuclear factor erythroid 2-related factor 2b [Carassius gibelio]